ncbi:MAG TPA: hypothetical protein DCY42_04370 [Chloroflexi bacterium]|nr:hypothetical protein [Chloroflexota bacterium]
MDAYEQIKRIKDQYADQLMSKANVVGVGIGFAEHGGVRTDEMALVVMVNRKLPPEALAPADRIPKEIEGVLVDVQQVGDLHSLD